MGCGGSKEDVATGNTSAGSSKLSRRKSVGVVPAASHRSSHLSSSASSSSDDTSVVVVKDVVKKEPEADVDAPYAEKPAAVDEKKEDAVAARKDLTIATGALAVTEATATASQLKKEKDDEEELPESTMADETTVAEAAKADEAKEVVVLKEEEEEEEEEKAEETKAGEETTSPALATDHGESKGQNPTESASVEAKPAVDEHKNVEEVPAVSESSPMESGKKNTTVVVEKTPATAPSEPSPAN
ncbi:hypothetical protein GUJ93_ZPchr0010g10090 [Zizania palustris]|uniref:Uncharacterized protein n=1 Tax=Zizania palustris TaxID=103762 RepID=A0A8J5WBS6_ZIZPA|nr:hypothetical protein GUJ93_ZPchr0010g10090 [Zizania palustris]